MYMYDQFRKDMEFFNAVLVCLSHCIKPRMRLCDGHYAQFLNCRVFVSKRAVTPTIMG